MGPSVQSATTTETPKKPARIPWLVAELLLAAIGGAAGYFTVSFSGTFDDGMGLGAGALPILADVWVVATVAFVVAAVLARSTFGAVLGAILGLVVFSALSLAMVAERMAFDDWVVACDSEGDAESCYKLATFYRRGTLVSKDVEMAIRMDLEACQDLYAPACTRLIKEHGSEHLDVACEQLRVICRKESSWCDEKDQYCPDERRQKRKKAGAD